jgi:hypothetical protein
VASKQSSLISFPSFLAGIVQAISDSLGYFIPEIPNFFLFIRRSWQGVLQSLRTWYFKSFLFAQRLARARAREFISEQQNLHLLMHGHQKTIS